MHRCNTVDVAVRDGIWVARGMSATIFKWMPVQKAPGYGMIFDFVLFAIPKITLHSAVVWSKADARGWFAEKRQI